MEFLGRVVLFFLIFYFSFRGLGLFEFPSLIALSLALFFAFLEWFFDRPMEESKQASHPVDPVVVLETLGRFIRNYKAPKHSLIASLIFLVLLIGLLIFIIIST